MDFTPQSATPSSSPFSLMKLDADRRVRPSSTIIAAAANLRRPSPSTAPSSPPHSKSPFHEHAPSSVFTFFNSF